MRNRFVNSKLLFELSKIVLFGLLSLIFSKLQFVVPGTDSNLSDMREVALVISLFYLRYWPSVIILSVITALGIHEGGSFIATFSMHAIGLMLVYFIYKYLNNKLTKRVYFLGSWVVVVSLYFYLIVIPIMVVFHYFLGLIELNTFIDKYKDISTIVRFEFLITASITSIYLLYLKTTQILEIQNNNLLKSMQKAEESEQLKTAFLQNLSHEIRTPLNGIMGFSKLLQQNDDGCAQNNLYTGHIIASGDQLLNIVNDVVDASHIETKQSKTNITEKKVGDIMHEVLLALESKGKSELGRINFNINGCSDVVIESDAYKLVRINFHLLDNALKFSKEMVQLSCSVANKKLQIKIEDQGIGIAHENRDEIFKKFRQIDRVITRDYGGNGLGLAIVKGFVQELNGNVNFTSELKKGTTFIVSIPLEYN